MPETNDTKDAIKMLFKIVANSEDKINKLERKVEYIEASLEIFKADYNLRMEELEQLEKKFKATL